MDCHRQPRRGASGGEHQLALAVHRGGCGTSLTYVTAVAAGVEHTCAVVTASKQAFCWGEGFAGRLGAGDMVDQPLPTAVVAPDATSEVLDVVSIAAGMWHSCAVRSNGGVYCWGPDDNRVGAYGCEGGTNDGDVCVSNVDCPDGECSAAKTCAGGSISGVMCGSDVDCLGGGTCTWAKIAKRAGGVQGEATMVAVGNEHSCALVVGGQLRCWGSDTSGQLGDGGGVASKATPVLVDQTSIFVDGANKGTACSGDGECVGSECDGLDYAVFISAGALHTCVVDADGHVWCWGENIDGRLGNEESGVAKIADAPVRVTGGSAWP